MTILNPGSDHIHPARVTGLGNLGRPSVFAGADVCETAQLVLRPGAKRPKFEDDVWVFEGLADAPETMWPREKRWDFTLIHNPTWRIVAKEYLLASLNPHHDEVLALPHAHRRPRNPRTLYYQLVVLTRWFNWLTAEGVRRLTEVTQDHCDVFLAQESYSTSERHGSRTPRRLNQESISFKIRVLQFPAMFSELYSTDRFAPGFIPWNGRSAYEVAGVKPSKANSTPPVPDQVYGPALAAALYMVNVLGPKVIALIAEVDQAAADASTCRQHTSAADLPKLRRCLEQARASGTPLPRAEVHHVKTRLQLTWREDDPLLWVTLAPMTLSIGKQKLHPKHWDLLRDDIQAALRQVGLEEQWCRNTAAVPRADDDQQTVPWSLPIAATEVRSLASLVLFASMYVTFALTGMRATELWEVTRGSRRVDAIAGGKRYRLASRVIKARRFGGEPDEWVVLPEVDQAMLVAEELTGVPEGHTVFGRRYSFYDGYKRFHAWVNGPAGQRLGLTPIPAGQVNARMLRRTLALCLAKRPGGVLAAKVALKHVSVATTEGYVAVPGGSQAQFMAEVEEIEEEHHLKLTVEEFRKYQEGKLPSGPGARHLIEVFAHVDAELKDLEQTAPKVVDNERRIENLLRQTAGTLHIGVANYCWFRDPSQALCLRMAGTPDATKPLAGMCDSSRCPQATHHPCHRPAWDNHATNQKVFLENPRIAKDEKNRVRPEYERTLKIIAQIDAAQRGADEDYDTDQTKEGAA